MTSTPFDQSPLHHPTATVSPGSPEQQIANALGAGSNNVPYDPAFAARHDRLADANPKSMASLVTRDIPLTTSNTAWDIGGVRSAMQSLVIGLFDAPSQLVESIVGDSRVQAAMLQRHGALLSSPVKFRLPKKYKDDPAAKKCLRAWEKIWPLVAGEAQLSELLQWSTHLGFGIAQINWDTTTSNIWRPYITVWNPRYSYYHWLYRCYIAIGLDGQYPIFGGDGHWILHAPHGEYRGWIRGSMRAIAPWWLARNYALRDWARYSERNGMPWIKGKTPAAGDKEQIESFRSALALLWQETAISLPQGVEPHFGYDVELLESNIAGASDGFEKLIDRCSDEIILSIMGNNLTTEVTGGSLAASKAHQSASNLMAAAEGRALATTLTQQVIRPFALFNFGNADFAPIAEWNTDPPEDEQIKASCFASFAKGISDLKSAGFAIENVEQVAKDLGLRVKLKESEVPMPEMPGAPGSPKPGGPGAAVAKNGTGHKEPDGDEGKEMPQMPKVQK